MSVQLVLDTRERDLFLLLQKDSFPFKSETLAVGDVVFKKESRILALCERKTVADMLSSIKTGRYREQRNRLKTAEQTSAIKIFYIIEGPLGGIKTPCMKGTTEKELAMIGGALENLVLYHDIHVLPTASLAHTCQVLKNICKKLSDKEPTKSEKENTSKKLVPVMHVRKNIVKESMFGQQLLLIDGISPKIATTITTLYPTVKSLMEAYQENAKPELLLSEISLGKRKIGPVLSKRVHSVYCD